MFSSEHAELVEQLEHEAARRVPEWKVERRWREDVAAAKAQHPSMYDPG